MCIQLLSKTFNQQYKKKISKRKEQMNHEVKINKVESKIKLTR